MTKLSMWKVKGLYIVKGPYVEGKIAQTRVEIDDEIANVEGKGFIHSKRSIHMRYGR